MTSTDSGDKEITFYALVGPFKRRIKYASLELEGDKIFYIAEKDGNKKKLAYLGINKKDVRILREHISKLQGRGSV